MGSSNQQSFQKGQTATESKTFRIRDEALRVTGNTARTLVTQWALNRAREKFAEVSSGRETSIKVGRLNVWLFQSPDVQIEQNEIETLENNVKNLSDAEIARFSLPGLLLRDRLNAQFLSESTLKAIVNIEIERRRRLDDLRKEKRKRVHHDIFWLMTEITTLGVAVVGWLYFR